MGYCKLQLGCMLIILYIMFTNYKECSRIRQKFKLTLFDGLLILGMVCVFFDGLTAFTVNYLEKVNQNLNRIFHLFFLICIDSFIFLLFLYMQSMW